MDEKQLEKERKKFAAAMRREPSLEAADDKGRSDLHHAATLNLPALTTSLLDSGMDVNTKDKEGMVPLHIAAMENEVEVPKVLLHHGADVDTKDKDGLTPLHIAAARNSLAVAEFLLQNGADINAKNYYNGLTPLHIATMRNVVEAAEFLLHNGADADAKKLPRRTDAAAHCDHAKCFSRGRAFAGTRRGCQRQDQRRLDAVVSRHSQKRYGQRGAPFLWV